MLLYIGPTSDDVSPLCIRTSIASTQDKYTLRWFWATPLNLYFLKVISNTKIETKGFLNYIKLPNLI